MSDVRKKWIIGEYRAEANKDINKITYELYLWRHLQYTLRELVTYQLVTIRKNQAYDLRNAFIMECAEWLGIIDLKKTVTDGTQLILPR